MMDDAQTDAPLPCPFCGNPGAVVSHSHASVWGSESSVQCQWSGCGASSGWFLQGALASWNRRAALASPRAPLEVDDLAALVRRLAHHVCKSEPDNDLAKRAMGYLQRHDLQGSPLRASPRATGSQERFPYVKHGPNDGDLAYQIADAMLAAFSLTDSVSPQMREAIQHDRDELWCLALVTCFKFASVEQRKLVTFVNEHAATFVPTGQREVKASLTDSGEPPEPELWQIVCAWPEGEERVVLSTDDECVADCLLEGLQKHAGPWCVAAPEKYFKRALYTHPSSGALERAAQVADEFAASYDHNMKAAIKTGSNAGAGDAIGSARTAREIAKAIRALPVSGPPAPAGAAA